jgi:hypothetical protein
MMDDAAVASSDRAERFWTSSTSGMIPPGSLAHKTAFCRMLIETHNPYKPRVVDWPRLDPEARDRLVRLPIWDIAVQIEGQASLNVLGLGEVIADPLLREAIQLNGREEARHKEVLSNLVAAYGIQLAPEPAYAWPRRPEWAFMTTGFSECIDSFFAFGLFAMAKRSNFFPPELVDTFEPVMQEEARHILFFVNWVAWHRRNLPWWRRPWFWAKIVAVWIYLLRERVGLARGIEGGADAALVNNFALTGSKTISEIDFSAAALIDICLEENQRRIEGYDPRLLRPQMVPRLARLIRRFLRTPKSPDTGA